MSPAKHSYGSVTDGRTDGQTTDKVIPMCRYASQATQKLPILQSHSFNNKPINEFSRVGPGYIIYADDTHTTQMTLRPA